MELIIYGTCRSGWIECITGSMFNGKSEGLIRRLKRRAYAKQKVIVFKPAINDRYHKEEVVSHNDSELETTNISTAREVLLQNLSQFDVISIDEIQFFDNEIVHIIEELAEDSHGIVVAGLDMDFRGKPFDPMPQIMAVSEQVAKLQTVCAICGSSSSRMQRLVNGQPTRIDDPIILVGTNESYEPRCGTHHIVAPSVNDKEEI